LASDRIRDDGIIAFITNRNFIEKSAFDGFRKIVARDFEEIWLMDLGGDVRANPKISGTKHNVFGIQTGVAISFFIKKKGKGDALIRYSRRPEMETREDKLSFLAGNPLPTISFDSIQSDRKWNWINLTNTDWEGLIPAADRKARADQAKSRDRTIFRLISNGLETKRDEWVYDVSHETLEAKARFLIDAYERTRRKKTPGPVPIKWDRELEKHLRAGVVKDFDAEAIRLVAYRPFSPRLLYFDRHLNAFHFQLLAFFPTGSENIAISLSDVGFRS
jgi:predicted helicase